MNDDALASPLCLLLVSLMKSHHSQRTEYLYLAFVYHQRPRFALGPRLMGLSDLDHRHVFYGACHRVCHGGAFCRHLLWSHHHHHPQQSAAFHLRLHLDFEAFVFVHVGFDFGIFVVALYADQPAFACHSKCSQAQQDVCQPQSQW